MLIYKSNTGLDQISREKGESLCQSPSGAPPSPPPSGLFDYASINVKFGRHRPQTWPRKGTKSRGRKKEKRRDSGMMLARRLQVRQCFK